MNERSEEKSTHVNFDDVKAACAVPMSVDAKISQAKTLHQRLLLTKLKEKSEITLNDFEERAVNCAKRRRSRRLIFLSSSVDPDRAMVNQEYSLN